MSYVEQIDAEIAELKDRLIKLEHAREVMAKLERKGPKTIDVTPEKKASGKITIARIQAPKGKRQRGKSEMGLSIAELCDLALQAVREVPGETGTEIAKRMGFTEEVDQKRVWYALKRLYDDGKVVKDGARYRLPAEHAEAAE
jgi:hypothetical protein